MSARVTIVVDGKSIEVEEGISVAAALMSNDVQSFRRSVRGEPRGPLCGMGICHECRVTIDGAAHRRACLVTVSSGLEIVTAEGDA